MAFSTNVWRQSHWILFTFTGFSLGGCLFHIVWYLSGKLMNEPGHHVSAHSILRIPLLTISCANATSASLRREALPALFLLSHWCQLTEVTVYTVQQEPIDFWPTRIRKQCLPMFLNQYGHSASQQRHSDWLPLCWPSWESKCPSTGHVGGNGQVLVCSCSTLLKAAKHRWPSSQRRSFHWPGYCCQDTTWTLSDPWNFIERYTPDFMPAS